MTRQRCYERARSWEPKLPDLDALQLVEDDLRNVTKGVYARVLVGIDTRHGAGPASGYVIAVSEAIRKCRLVVYETAASAPEEVADRLALVAHRMLDSLRLDDPLSPTTREPFPPSGSAR